MFAFTCEIKLVQNVFPAALDLPGPQTLTVPDRLCPHPLGVQLAGISSRFAEFSNKLLCQHCCCCTLYRLYGTAVQVNNNNDEYLFISSTPSSPVPPISSDLTARLSVLPFTIAPEDRNATRVFPSVGKAKYIQYCETQDWLLVIHTAVMQE